MKHRIDRDCEESHHDGLRHILPFLAVPLAIGVVHKMAHHRFARMGMHHPQEWKNGVPPMFAELHRRAHAAQAEAPTEQEA